MVGRAARIPAVIGRICASLVMRLITKCLQGDLEGDRIVTYGLRLFRIHRQLEGGLAKEEPGLYAVRLKGMCLSPESKCSTKASFIPACILVLRSEWCACVRHE